MKCAVEYIKKGIMRRVEGKRDKGPKKGIKDAGIWPQFSTGGKISHTGFFQRPLTCPNPDDYPQFLQRSASVLLCET